MMTPLDSARFAQIVHKLIHENDVGSPLDRAMVLRVLSMIEGGDQAARDLIDAAPADQMAEIREHMEAFTIEERMPPLDDVLKSLENL